MSAIPRRTSAEGRDLEHFVARGGRLSVLRGDWREMVGEMLKSAQHLEDC